MSEDPRAALVVRTLKETAAAHERMAANVESVVAVADAITKSLKQGGSVLVFGNGGSAADAQHFAAELVGRYEKERKGWPAVALTTDTSALTAIGNDYGFERVFARQIEALGRRGDLLVAMTTSGRSPNVLEAVRAARARGLAVIGMTGGGGAAFARRCDAALVVPSRETARIQEVHLLVGHILCERAEDVARTRRSKEGGPRRARKRRR